MCPDCTVIVQYAGVTPDAFRNPGKGKELALSQYQQGVNVIYHASGSTGLGVFEAARQTGKFAIGVDADQYDEAPGRILTSMVKGIDVAVFDMIKRVRDGTFKGGVYMFGLPQNGVGYVYDEHNRMLIPDSVRTRVEQLKARHHRREDQRAEYEMSMADAPVRVRTRRFASPTSTSPSAPCAPTSGASLEVARGEIHALVGENGAGKSTLMRMLSGMYAPDSGRMEVNGRDVTGWTTADAIDAGVGMVHQHFMLVPTLTVAENVMLGRELTKRAAARHARAPSARSRR